MRKAFLVPMGVALAALGARAGAADVATPSHESANGDRGLEPARTDRFKQALIAVPRGVQQRVTEAGSRIRVSSSPSSLAGELFEKVERGFDARITPERECVLESFASPKPDFERSTEREEGFSLLPEEPSGVSIETVVEQELEHQVGPDVTGVLDGCVEPSAEYPPPCRCDSQSCSGWSECALLDSALLDEPLSCERVDRPVDQRSGA